MKISIIVLIGIMVVYLLAFIVVTSDSKIGFKFYPQIFFDFKHSATTEIKEEFSKKQIKWVMFDPSWNDYTVQYKDDTKVEIKCKSPYKLSSNLLYFALDKDELLISIAGFDHLVKEIQKEELFHNYQKAIISCSDAALKEKLAFNKIDSSWK